MFRLNGKKVPKPIQDSFKVLQQVIFQEEGTGRNQKGDMVLTVIGRAQEIEMEWKFLNKNELILIKNELDKIIINVGIPDILNKNKIITSSFYCSEYPIERIDGGDEDFFNIQAKFISMKLK